jgi:CBS domain-containing protein
MHAAELAVELPLLPRSSTISDTFRLIAEHDLLAVVIIGDDGRVEAIASPVDITRLVLPGYALADLSLAGLLDDSSLEELFTEADARSVGAAIDAGDLGVRGVVEIDADATVLETACHMVANKAQLVRLSGDGTPRFVFLSAVLDALLAARDGRAGRP